MTQQPPGPRWSPAQGPRPPRSWPRLVAGQWPLAVLLFGVSAGVLWAGVGHWKRGSFLIGVTFLVGTVLRTFLAEDRVGLLGVRNRAVDVVCMAVLGVGIVVLSLIVPPQR